MAVEPTGRQQSIPKPWTSPIADTRMPAPFADSEAVVLVWHLLSPSSHYRSRRQPVLRERADFSGVFFFFFLSRGIALFVNAATVNVCWWSFVVAYHWEMKQDQSTLLPVWEPVGGRQTQK